MALKKLIQLQDIVFASNSDVQIEIPKGERIRRIACFLTGTRTTTGYTADGVIKGVAQDNPLRLIRRVALVADGETLQAWDGCGYYYHNTFMYGNAPLKAAITLTGAAVTGQAFSAHFFIDLIQPKSAFPIDTVLDTRRYTNIFLVVTWGTYDDLNQGYTLTTAVVDSTTVMSVMLETTTGLSDAEQAPAGISKRFQEEEELTGTSTERVFNLTTTQNLLRSLGIRQIEDNLTDANPVDGFNRHTLVLNYDQYMMNRIKDAQLKNLHNVADQFGSYLTGQQAITGYRWPDFSQDGYIRNMAIRQRIVTNLQYIADITKGTNANYVRFYRDEIGVLR